MSEGFIISTFVQDLGNVRMMAQAEDSAIYVTRRAQGDAPRNEDGNGSADGEPITAAAGLTA